MKKNHGVAMSFALIGIVIAVVRLAPWTDNHLYLLNSVFGQILAISISGITMAILGSYFSKVFIQKIDLLQFAKAALYPSISLWASTSFIIFIYSIILILTGDFGRSVGIFGTHHPSSNLELAFGPLMVFIVGTLLTSLSSLFWGFLLGWLSTVLFKLDHFIHYQQKQG